MQCMKQPRRPRPAGRPLRAGPHGGCSSEWAAALTRAAAGDEGRTAAAPRYPRTLITFFQKRGKTAHDSRAHGPRRPPFPMAMHIRLDEPCRVGPRRRDGRFHHRASRHRVVHLGGDRGPGAPQPGYQGLRDRHRGDRLHPGDAARVRRRPHRRDRQHHPQAHGRGSPSPVGRLLVLPGALQRRVRAGPPALPGRQIPCRTRPRGTTPSCTTSPS